MSDTNRKDTNVKNSSPNSGSPNPHEDEKYVDPFAGTEDPAEEFEAMENARREEELLSDYISFKRVATKIVRIFPARGVPIIEKEYKGKKTGTKKHQYTAVDLTYDTNNRKEQKLELGRNSNALLEPLIDEGKRLFRIVKTGELMSTLYTPTALD
jgi:hypothetical protein